MAGVPRAGVKAVLTALGGALMLGSCSKPLEPIGPVPVAVPATRPPDPIPRPEPIAEPEPIPTDPAPRVDPPSDGIAVRVALLAGPRSFALAADGPWRLLDARGGTLVRARAGEAWSVQMSGRRMRAARPDGSQTAWVTGVLRQVAESPAGAVRVSGRRYRGSLSIVPSDSGLLVVNAVGLEDYLRGVVPREIGNRDANERAAVEAQAIAARSFTVTRLVTARAGNGRSPDFDFVASVSDQVYGGRDAELPRSDAAIAATRGRVLLLHGRVATTPFHSTCGGETAAAEEVWRSDGEPHLKRVSDRIPGSDRYYCDIAPRFAWSRAYTGDELDAVIKRYMGAYAPVGRDGPGSVRSISVEGRTPSGRVRELEMRTTHGTYRLRGNDARSVLRSPSGEMLNSPYFSVSPEAGSGGRLARVVIRGNGYGHGVGMCQWGAIGRARAGQDARTILRTYFPGTTIGAIPAGLLTR